MQMAALSWSCTVGVSGNNCVVMLMLSLWEVLGIGSRFSEQISFFRDLYHWLWGWFQEVSCNNCSLKNCF